MIKEFTEVPIDTLVVVSNKKLKSYGKVFRVYDSRGYHNKFVDVLKVVGNGLRFSIHRSNLSFVTKAKVEAKVEVNEVEGILSTQYRVANSANQILKDVFPTVEDAQAAILKWAGGLNQQIEFQILTVVKSYKANREIVLEELK